MQYVAITVKTSSYSSQNNHNRFATKQPAVFLKWWYMTRDSVLTSVSDKLDNHQ